MPASRHHHHTSSSPHHYKHPFIDPAKTLHPNKDLPTLSHPQKQRQQEAKSHIPRYYPTMPPPRTSPLPTLFLTEATLKLISAAIFIASPPTILKHLVPAPYSPLSTSLIRAFGTQTLAFSVPLFLAARGGGKETRRIVYVAMLAREGFLAVGLVGEMVGLWARGRKGGEGDGGKERAVEEGRVGEERAMGEEEDERRGVLIRGLGLWVAELVPFVFGRVWVLGWRGEWFE